MGESPAQASVNTGSVLFLFGPQILSFNKQSFDKLRATVLNRPSNRWMLDTVSELPRYWTVASQHIPKLRSVPGEQLLQDLDRWFRTGTYPDGSFDLPNTVLTPLVVLVQLMQYSRYRELGGPRPESPERSSTLGFCTGILSAFAVSASAPAGKEELDQFGAVAVRLAMLVGALVDAQEASDTTLGRARSYTTAWNTSQQVADMTRILDQFPEVRVCSQFTTVTQRTNPLAADRPTYRSTVMRKEPPSPPRKAPVPC